MFSFPLFFILHPVSKTLRLNLASGTNDSYLDMKNDVTICECLFPQMICSSQLCQTWNLCVATITRSLFSDGKMGCLSHDKQTQCMSAMYFIFNVT